MTNSPAAGAPAANQYGVFKVHAPSAAQIRFVAALVARKDAGNPAARAELAGRIEAYRNGTLNKKAATKLIDDLLALPDAAKPAAEFNPAYRVSEKQVSFLRRLAAERDWVTAVGADHQDAADTIAATIDTAVAPDELQVTKREASKAIDFLMTTPKAARNAAATEPEVGMYRTSNGTILRCYLGQQSGRNLIKMVVRDEVECDGHESTDGPIGNVVYCDGTCQKATYRYEYVGSALNVAKGASKLGAVELTRMSLDEAKAWGRMTSTCCVCAARLDDPESVEAGIGPVCAKRV